ncbi:MAG: glutamate--tRNA ligase [Deltaproteobacteria bacterium]|nr:glutamate--tRNA ligase [Deltaproteobacteria bacterium]
MSLFQQPIRVRMAPSPTGFLHIGGARTALFNYLFAKHYKGTFVLRIEDTDKERSTKGYEKAIIEDLGWLGVEWDEGPLKEGSYGPYYQSQRIPTYQKYLKKLEALSKVYPCYCTAEELETERQDLLKRHKTPRYLGKCRNLTQQERKALEAQGRVPVIRFKIDETEPIQFHDLIRGDISVDPTILGDFVISKGDGWPLYNFAAVVDDCEMKISHVIRGEEHISNTPRQILLAKTLGLTLPQYAHVSIILAPDRSKLSKRHGATSVGEYRKMGFLPQALKNYLALLGWNPGDEREMMGEEELAKDFVIERMVKSPAIFDVEKLKWMNGMYIRNSSVEAMTKETLPFLESYGLEIQNKKMPWLNSIIETVRGSVDTLDQIGPAAELFFDEKFSLNAEAKTYLVQNKDKAKEILKTLDDLLAKTPLLEKEEFQKLQAELKEKVDASDKKILFQVQRVAVTGRLKGPEMNMIMPILGVDSCRKRIHITQSALS